MSALAELRHRYRDRYGRAVEHRRTGGAVVGYVGADVPRETIEAAGLYPLRLAPVAGVDCRFADRVLGRGVEPALRLVLAGLLEGVYPIDYLLLCHDREATVRLFGALRALAALDTPIWFLDLLHGATAAVTAYNQARLVELEAMLEQWSGRPLERGRAAASTEVERTRRLAARLAVARREGRISGADALAVLGAGTVLPAAEFNDLLERALAELPGEPRAGRRIYLAGSDHPTPDLYDALDELGATVVAESHGFGERLYAAGEPHGPAGVELVLGWLRSGDEALAWSLPALRRRARAPFRLLDRRGLALGRTDLSDLRAVLAET